MNIWGSGIVTHSSFFNSHLDVWDYAVRHSGALVFPVLLLKGLDHAIVAIRKYIVFCDTTADLLSRVRVSQAPAM